LLVKPYQPTYMRVACPPLGLLYLASTLRKTFGTDVEVRLLDLTVQQGRYFDARELLKEFRPHVVGLSALNWEAEESGRFALMTQTEFPGTIVAIGGPFAHRNTQKICATGVFDWIFDGEADWSFPIACQRWFRGDKLLDDIVGLTWRTAAGEPFTNNAEFLSLGLIKPAGVVDDLDAIPLPAWDLIDFDRYAKVRNFMSLLKGKRYATIFTSRGCPFQCTYCHDIFGKTFRYRSPENVAAEVKMLRDLGVDELEIVDDIFNMNPPRMKAVCRAIEPYKMYIAFPNGLRFDILDEEGCEALTRAGTYAACVAIETITPRLQTLIKKHLRVDRAQQAIRWMANRGVLIRGFFMLGFPTETREEIEATIDYAVKSDLTQAYFFNVVPQPGTPLYDLALKENAAALESQTLLEYNAKTPWYMAAYGVNMPEVIKKAYVRFFVLSPKRWVRLIRRMPWKNFVMEFRDFVRLFAGRKRKDFEPLPEELLPLSHLYAADAVSVTSAQTHSSPFRRKLTYSFESRVSPPKATTGSPDGLSTA
jgi:anaerobic magnesium-protoporphyrin IX monomethyl ester cyclase